MSRFVRHRNSKRLSYRMGGKFARQPSLEESGRVRVCECGQLLTPSFETDEMGIVSRVWPKTCHHCGKDQ